MFVVIRETFLAVHSCLTPPNPTHPRTHTCIKPTGLVATGLGGSRGSTAGGNGSQFRRGGEVFSILNDCICFYFFLLRFSGVLRDSIGVIWSSAARWLEFAPILFVLLEDLVRFVLSFLWFCCFWWIWSSDYDLIQCCLFYLKIWYDSFSTLWFCWTLTYGGFFLLELSCLWRGLGLLNCSSLLK